MKNKRRAVLAVGFLALAGLLILRPGIWRQAKPAQSPSSAVMYTSFGPSNAFSPHCWSAGANAHADWFVPKVSGRLNGIAIAAEPYYVRKGLEKTAGDLDLFLAEDESGFPGKVLERFSLAASAPSSPPPSLPLVFKSVAQPKL
jgi:hypothetical protein